MTTSNTEALIWEYNSVARSLLLGECSCYDTYKNFKAAILVDRQSYMACVVVNHKRVGHKVFPIMVGSFPDYLIRGSNVDADKSLFGSFYIKGSPHFLPNFLTNNLRSGYRWTSVSGDIYSDYRWTLIHDGYTVNMVYDKGAVKCVARKYISSREAAVMKRKLSAIYHDTSLDINNYNWLKAINETSLFPDDTCTEAEYLEFFESAYRNHPILDYLANKLVITAPALMIRTLQIYKSTFETTENANKSDIEKNIAFTQTFVKKLQDIYERGNMYFAITKNRMNHVNLVKESLWIPIEMFRMNHVYKLVGQIKRSTTAKQRNSKALFYPEDAFGFICPANVREMNGAGENLFFSLMTWPTLNLDDDVVCVYIKKNFLNDKILKLDHLFLVVEGYLTHYQIRDDTANFIKIKHDLKHVTFMQYDKKYLLLSTRGHIPAKYSPKYEMIVSPYEKTHLFPNAFDEYKDIALLSPHGLCLPDSFVKTMPEKVTVAINNIKGGCAVIKDTGFTLESFLYGVGSNTSLNYRRTDEESKIVADAVIFNSKSKPCRIPLDFNRDPESRCYYTKYAILENELMPEVVKNFYANLPSSTLNDIECNGRTLLDVLPNMSKHMKIYRNILQATDYQHIFYEENPNFEHRHIQTLQKGDNCDSYILMSSFYYKTTNQKYTGTVSKMTTKRKRSLKYGIESKTSSTTYSKYVNTQNVVKHNNHLVLWTAIGDYRGGTCEDGIILDSNFVKNSPTKFVNNVFKLQFQLKSGKYFKRNGKLSDNKFGIVYHAQNSIIRSRLIFGDLVSSVELIPTTRVHAIGIESSNIGKLNYRYTIYTTEYTNISKVLESNYKDGTLFITYRYEKNLDISTKISNNHGQKGLVSLVADLSHIKAWQQDGTCIHPQILFSPTSTIGRTTASQIYEMAMGKSIAVTQYGGLIAKMSYNVHHIESTTKAIIALPKNDVMTNENGFVGNMLSRASQCLRNETSKNRASDSINFITQLYKLKGIAITPVNYNNVKQIHVSGNFKLPLWKSNNDDKDDYMDIDKSPLTGK